MAKFYFGGVAQNGGCFVSKEILMAMLHTLENNINKKWARDQHIILFGLQQG